MPFDENLSNSLELDYSPLDNPKFLTAFRERFNRKFFRNESESANESLTEFFRRTFRLKVRRDRFGDFFKTVYMNKGISKDLKFPKPFFNFLAKKERFYDFTENEMFNFMNYFNLSIKNDIRTVQYSRMKDYYDKLIDPEQP